MATYGEQEEGVEEVGGDELNKKLTQKNTLPVYGNKETMNINPMILSNIQGSAYFKEELYTLKTFHEVVDEIFYKVDHLEPWEKGSRKLAGQVGMCGGVRGVAAGGIVSTAYCLLFKLFTLKLTRRQVQAMLDHVDSPYIRGLGFMYIRYCQPPADFWDWFEPYLDDPEEIDLKAGGGFKTTVGVVCRMMLTKLDWFGTMLPRISVSVSKNLEQKLKAISKPDRPNEMEEASGEKNGETEERRDVWGEAARRARTNEQAGSAERKERYSPPGRRLRGDVTEQRSRSRDRYSRERRRRSRDRRERSRSRDRRERSRSRDRRERSRSRDRRERSRSRDRRERSRSRDRDRYRRRSRSRDRRKSRSRSRDKRRRSNSPRRRSRSRSRERRRSHSRDRRRRSQSHSGDRRRSRSHSRDRKRSRSRSRERRRNRSRDKYTKHRSSSRDRK